jgi:ElaB/YqjD/DUF883 family membrane-anchored ribosome-binding protein
MTKQQEIAILHETIDRLGANSYLAGWLQSVAAEVESLIQSDIEPSVSTLDNARKKADEIIAKAKEESADIRARAAFDANHIRAKADEYWERISTTLYSAARKAINELNS